MPPDDRGRAATQPFRGLRTSGSERIGAFDLVRTFAILGMICAHIGPITSRSIGEWAWLRQVEGRSAAAFAILLGSSSAMMFRSRSAKVGANMARAEQVLRGLLLFGAGVAMTKFPTGVVVVLATLGLASILSIPALRWSTKRAVIVALSLGVLGPPFSYWLRITVIKQSALTGKHFMGVPKPESFTNASRFGWMIVDLFFTGVYPLVTWLPLVLVGIALAQSNLRDPKTRRTLMVAAITLLVLRFGGLAALRSVFDLDAKVLASLADKFPDAEPDRLQRFLERGAPGAVYPADWRLLFYANTHSGSWLDLAGTIGVMLAVFRVSLSVADRFPRATRIVSSPGRLAFTIYVTHILARYVLIQRAATPDMTPGERNGSAAFEPSTLLVFLLIATIASTLWSVFIGQGPLEWLLRFLSRKPLARFAPPPRVTLTATADQSAEAPGTSFDTANPLESEKSEAPNSTATNAFVEPQSQLPPSTQSTTISGGNENGQKLS